MDNVYVALLATLLVSTLIVAIPFIILFVQDKKRGTIKLKDCEIEHELEFGGVNVKISIKDFNKLGFEFGDSVNIYFSNGYTYRDIPYYNGYYTKTGDPLLLGYAGSEYVKIAISNGADLWNIADLNQKTFADEKNLLWDMANLSKETKVTITLFEKRKYLQIQQARDIHYFDERETYPSDEVFANFRSMTGGKLKCDYFFRSASPCDNQHNRAYYVDTLIKKSGIKFVINLADDDAKIQNYINKPDFNSPNFKNLFDATHPNNDAVETLALNMDYNSKYFKEQTVKAMLAILKNEGPFLIHCTEGKDRTGFVCMLIEALAGASYQEIAKDYMKTYTNYYSVANNFDEKKYEIIVEMVLNPMIKSIVGKSFVDIKNTNLSEYAKKFLLKNGMTESEVQNLLVKITE